MSLTRPRSYDDEVAQDAERRPEVVLGISERQAAAAAFCCLLAFLVAFLAGMLQ